MLSQTEIRQTITDKIIESLKKGKIPWRKPWTGIEGPRTPTNFVTKHRYSGINIPILWLAGQEKGYEVDYWASFRQWKSMDACVKKGEKATNVVFYKPIKKTVKDDDGSEKVVEFPIMRTFPVFSIHQVHGGNVESLLTQPVGQIHEHEQRESFEKMVAATNAEIRFGGSKAAYHRVEDYIVMPDEERFLSFPAFAETLAHELTHWTEHRLGWQGSYAQGELRAEMAACFITAAMSIPDANDLTNHTAYIQSWLQALQNDPKYIFQASSAASKAADYIMSFSKAVEVENDSELEAVEA